MKLKITLMLLLLQQLAFAQSVNLRKLVLNSDLILYLEMADYQYTSLPVNDHFSKDFVKITRAEKVLKNRGNTKFLNKEIPAPKEGNDYFDSAKINGGPGYMLGYPTEPGKRYFSLLFLKEVRGRLTVLAHITRANGDDWPGLMEKIAAIRALEDIRSPQEAYTRSVDYFLRYDDLSWYWDDAFRDYYRKAGLLKEDKKLRLTDGQTQLMKEKFLQGEELYYDQIAHRFPREVRGYYIEKMKKLQADKEEDFSAYDFKEAYERATQTDFMDGSELGLLKSSLYSEAPFPEKQKIMQQLTAAAEQALKGVGR